MSAEIAIGDVSPPDDHENPFEYHLWMFVNKFRHIQQGYQVAVPIYDILRDIAFPSNGMLPKIQNTNRLNIRPDAELRKTKKFFGIHSCEVKDGYLKHQIKVDTSLDFNQVFWVMLHEMVHVKIREEEYFSKSEWSVGHTEKFGEELASASAFLLMDLRGRFPELERSICREAKRWSGCSLGYHSYDGKFIRESWD